MAERKSITERLRAKVDKNGPVPAHMPHLGQCWVWTGSVTSSRPAYGRISSGWPGHGGRIFLVHRVSWVEANGPIPPETPHVLHHCDNSLCVRPAHLWVGTNVDNVRDRHSKGRDGSARGDSNGSRLYPARLLRGAANPNSKLTDDEVTEILRLAMAGYPTKLLEQHYPVKGPTLRKVILRQMWAHVPVPEPSPLGTVAGAAFALAALRGITEGGSLGVDGLRALAAEALRTIEAAR